MELDFTEESSRNDTNAFSKYYAYNQKLNNPDYVKLTKEQLNTYIGRNMLEVIDEIKMHADAIVVCQPSFCGTDGNELRNISHLEITTSLSLSNISGL